LKRIKHPRFFRLISLATVCNDRQLTHSSHNARKWLFGRAK
jgi:hypothetical protein